MMKFIMKKALFRTTAVMVVIVLLYNSFFSYLEREPFIKITLGTGKPDNKTDTKETEDIYHPVLASHKVSNRENEGNQYKIPHILHQFWDTDEVPNEFAEWIHSWVFRHPNWDYYLWTDEAVRKLISKHYPEHEALYTNYPAMLYRANAMRYFVLHHYGGVYADLDVEALRPVDTWLQGPHDCFLSLENFEHTYFHYGAEEPVIMNTIMGCRPDHPFYQAAIDKLAAFKNEKDTLHANGPFFLNQLYKMYSKMSSNDPVLAVQPKFFLPTFDPVILEKIQKGCVYSHRSSPKVKLLCQQLIATRWKNEPSEEAFTDHHWVHVNHKGNSWKETTSKFNIRDLVPYAANISLVIQT